MTLTAFPDITRAACSRSVTFEVSCADTRVGYHVRVVGSCQALGCWNPHKGFPLHTCAARFPQWDSTSSVLLPSSDVIEYKYVICATDGRVETWEERPNRLLHLDAIQNSSLLEEAHLVITECFHEGNTKEEFRFRKRSAFRAKLHRCHSPIKVPESLVLDVDTTETVDLPCLEGLLYSPTIRERAPSQSVQAFPDLTLQCSPEEARSTQSMVREESSSNLFQAADDLDEESLFEHQYELVGDGPLGEGTFGLVWRCHKQGCSERAAKIVRKARLMPRDMRHLLGDGGEIELHLAIKHPHIVELFEIFNEETTVTLVLEYCRGGDLFDAIVKRRPDGRKGLVEGAVAVAASHVLGALEYIHGKDVVHRDIKCENVLLVHQDVPAEQNVFKLCDFGFAARNRCGGLSDRLGSPDTVAPEILGNGTYGAPVDMWSSGVLMYMMISARPPFWAPTDSEVLRRVRTGNYNFTGEVWDDFPAFGKNFITSLMTVDPRRRPTAVQALQDPWLLYALNNDD
uniref:Non-specific serine/threonine protein kinase n=1 Tax=Noctiluca scintillans TaxID=2966 RepID=A0A7S1FGS7_NOCSC|mmetsp:Transcript_60150/g.160086  ORF Transcript_60150/g.160086 Transcript_60150/m.160086 type:complete len:514 (+) Transcript_60150:25-1566(+)